jgi:O-antigen/teichoic acid export membrane protein
MIKNFVKDSVKYLPAQIVPGIVGFISIPIITRLFSPQDYGNYSLVMATVMVLVTLLGWLPMSIVRFYPAYERDEKLGIFYGNVVKLTLISLVLVSVIFFIILLAIKAHLSEKLYVLMNIGIGVFVVTSILNVCLHVMRSQRQVNLYSGFTVWKSIAALGLGLLLIVLFKLNVEGLFWGVILSIVIALPLLWKKTMGNVSNVHAKIDFSLAKNMASYSFPLVVGNLAGWVLNLSDRYILEFFRGSQEVGIYSASYNISDRSIMFIISFFVLASGPLSMHIWEKDGEAKSKEFITKLTRYYLIVCIPAVAGLSVLAKPVMTILTGQQYLEGYKIIPFVAMGFLFFGIQLRFETGFLFYKKTNYITLAAVAAGLLNVFLNLIFIPEYGYIAAGITTSISYAILVFILIILSRRFFVWEFPFKSLINSLSASAIMGTIVYFLGSRLTSSDLLNLFLSVCLGGLIYFALLFILREFQAKEKEVMKKILDKYLPYKLIANK